MTSPPANDPTGHDVPPPAPRWVKMFLLATVAVAVMFAIVHLVGRGLHGH